MGDSDGVIKDSGTKGESKGSSGLDDSIELESSTDESNDVA